MSLSTAIEAALAQDKAIADGAKVDQKLWSRDYGEIEMDRLYDLCRQLNLGATLITTEI